MFRIVFVLDILDGNAVHAVRGERAKYQPVRSKICSSCSPLDMISALNPKEVYIADLNSLQSIGNNFELIKKISSKTKTMADIGAENIKDVEKCLKIVETAILGTETASLELMEKAAQRFPGRIDVSIDIKEDRVLTGDRNLNVEPEELVKMLNRYDLKDIIILDLNKVGTGAGVDTVFLRKIAELSSHTILVGGGIKDMNDIEALKEIGVGGTLVATAVHDGKIPPELLR